MFDPTIFDPTQLIISPSSLPPHWLRSAPSRSQHLTWLAGSWAGWGWISAGVRFNRTFPSVGFRNLRFGVVGWLTHKFFFFRKKTDHDSNPELFWNVSDVIFWEDMIAPWKIWAKLFEPSGSTTMIHQSAEFAEWYLVSSFLFLCTFIIPTVDLLHSLSWTWEPPIGRSDCGHLWCVKTRNPRRRRS